MKFRNVMVTGANRGIGLEFVRQLVLYDNPPCTIFATYRNENSLQDLKAIRDSSEKSQVVLIKMDITKEDTVEAARDIVEEYVGDKGLNLLINNAGIAELHNYPPITVANMEQHFLVNTVGPLLVYKIMLPLLEMAAVNNDNVDEKVKAAVLNITSFVGNTRNSKIRFADDLRVPAYKISKVALNMAMRTLSSDVKNVLVIIMYPGEIQIGRSETNKEDLEPKDSVSTMLHTLDNLDFSCHGSYVDRFGNEYQI